MLSVSEELSQSLKLVENNGRVTCTYVPKVTDYARTKSQKIKFCV